MSSPNSARPSGANSLLTIRFSSSDDEAYTHAAPAPPSSSSSSSYSDSGSDPVPPRPPQRPAIRPPSSGTPSASRLPPRAEISSDPEPPPNTAVPYQIFKVSWTSRTIRGQKNDFKLLDPSDHLVMTGKHKKISGHQVYQFFTLEGTRPTAHLEVQAKGQQFTLKVAVSNSNPNLDREIVGIAWDKTHNGLNIPYLHLLLDYGTTPYVASSKGERMGSLAFRGTTPGERYRFKSKLQEIGTDRKVKRLEEIPEIAEESKKNIVIVDDQGVVVFKMYKVANQMMSVHTVPFLGPLIGFAIAVAVIH